MDKKYLALLMGIILVSGLIISPVFASGFTEKGNIGLKVEKTNFLDWFFKPVIFAFVQPNVNVMPGNTVQMDSLEYMNCGLCDLAVYPAQINGYVIKVYNANGNMVEEQQFYNWEIYPGVDYISCGESANFVFYYIVPDNAVAGTWRIELEVAVSPIYPSLPSCIVAQDEGSFTVGTSCVNKEILVQKCIDENTLYYKPANSCEVTYTQCDQIISGGKCHNDKCQKVETCGDKICDEFENYLSCYEDCGSCGDKVCQIKYENSITCPQDCSKCGDGICSIGEALTCGKDCAVCGDGECCWYEHRGEAYECEEDCFPNPIPFVCGNDICESEDCSLVDQALGKCRESEDCSNCLADCKCPSETACKDGECVPDSGLPDLDTMVIITVIIFMIGIMGVLILKKKGGKIRK